MKRQGLIYAPTRQPREVQPTGTEPVPPRGKPETFAAGLRALLPRLVKEAPDQGRGTPTHRNHPRKASPMNYKDRLEALEASLPFFLASAWDGGFRAGEDVGNWYAVPLRQQPTHANPYRSKSALEKACDDLIDEME